MHWHKKNSTKSNEYPCQHVFNVQGFLTLFKGVKWKRALQWNDGVLARSLLNAMVKVSGYKTQLHRLKS